MKKSKFSDGEIIEALKRMEAGLAVHAQCREIGISTATLYRWRTKVVSDELLVRPIICTIGGLPSCRKSSQPSSGLGQTERRQKSNSSISRSGGIRGFGSCSN